MLFFVSSERPSMSVRRVASFSVVMIILGLLIAAKVELTRSMSSAVNWWWSPKVSGVMLCDTGWRSIIICCGDAMPVKSSMFMPLGRSASGRRVLPNTGLRVSYCSVVK